MEKSNLVLNEGGLPRPEEFGASLEEKILEKLVKIKGKVKEELNNVTLNYTLRFEPFIVDKHTFLTIYIISLRGKSIPKTVFQVALEAIEKQWFNVYAIEPNGESIVLKAIAFNDDILKGVE